MINIAVMGYGTVGKGVVRILENNKKELSNYVGDDIRLKYILDIRDFPDSPHKEKFIDSFDTIVNDKEINIVIETIGGKTIAYDFVKSSLLAGKSVVTSNKELVAEKGNELFKIADEKNIDFLFDASVGGGIPIIKPINECLVANKINCITAILNGTTNFILTKMFTDGISMQAALTLAQKLGYAEKDPRADIDGVDACRKICILSSLMMGKRVLTDQITTYGIRNICEDDVKYAESVNCVIKLIAQAKRLENDSLKVVVSPMFVSKNNQLSHVDDVFNAVLIDGDNTDEIMLFGKGAGSLPTASAVVADAMECIMNLKFSKHISFYREEYCSVKNYDSVNTNIYVKLKCSNKRDVISKIKEKFPESHILNFDNEKPNIIAFATDGKIESIKLGLNMLSVKEDDILEIMEIIGTKDFGGNKW